MTMHLSGEGHRKIGRRQLLAGLPLSLLGIKLLYDNILKVKVPPSEGQILHTLKTSNRFYAEYRDPVFGDTVFGFYPIEAESNDGLYDLIENAWKKYKDNEELAIAEVERNKDERRRRNLINSAKELYEKTFWSSKYVPRILKEGETYYVPLPTKFTSLEKVVEPPSQNTTQHF